VGAIISAAIEEFNQLFDEARNSFNFRPFIHDFPAWFLTHINGSRSPVSGMLREIMLKHHEMQASQESFAIDEILVFSQLKDKSYRGAITSNGQPRFSICVEWLLSFCGCNRIFCGDVISLNAIRSLNATSEGVPTKEACPSAGPCKIVAKFMPDFFNSLDHLRF